MKKHTLIASIVFIILVLVGGYLLVISPPNKEGRDQLDNEILVKLYYHDVTLDPNTDYCEANNYVEKSVLNSETVIKDTINALIESEYIEKNDDFMLNNINLCQDGTLTIGFPFIGGFTTGGSCRIGVLTSQIEKTALQFPEVKKVIYNPDVFQP